MGSGIVKGGFEKEAGDVAGDVDSRLRGNDGTGAVVGVTRGWGAMCHKTRLLIPILFNTTVFHVLTLR